MDGETSYRHILRDEFAFRQNSNPAYSLRAFSRDLGVSPALMSLVLAHKKNLGTKKARDVAKKLNLQGKDISLFEALVQSESGSKAAREIAKKRVKELTSDDYRMVSQDTFRHIADWTHYGVITAMQLDEFDGTPRWLSEKLGLKLTVVNEVLERLTNLDFVSDSSGEFKVIKTKNTTTNDTPSAALRMSHAQTIDQAKEALEKQSVEKRDITSIMLTIDNEKIPLAKEKIKKFRREMADLLEGGKKNAVYNLNIQFYEITKS